MEKGAMIIFGDLHVTFHPLFPSHINKRKSAAAHNEFIRNWTKDFIVANNKHCSHMMLSFTIDDGLSGVVFSDEVQNDISSVLENIISVIPGTMKGSPAPNEMFNCKLTILTPNSSHFITTKPRYFHNQLMANLPYLFPRDANGGFIQVTNHRNPNPRRPAPPPSITKSFNALSKTQEEVHSNSESLCVCGWGKAVELASASAPGKVRWYEGNLCWCIWKHC
jgi:hypothetical protein